MNLKPKLLMLLGILWSFLLCLIIVLPNSAKAATFSVNPPTGTFTVGSTFDVSIYLNTENRPINAVEVAISFPPDMLQLVSPSTGKSVIGVWTTQPTINNEIGRVDFQGGIPGGINVSNGLITTLTFRVKSVGNAAIKFFDNSKALLHDGKGTNDLNNTNNGVYSLVLPPPAGPIVSSETHPQQNIWYQATNVVLKWADEDKVDGYSYIFSDNPVDVPDDIVDSKNNSIVYRNVGDGTHYFHIKAFHNGNWGGVTHFAVKVDSTPPADFNISVLPGSRTVSKQPIFEFTTTDELSGVDHYESKLIPLNKPKSPGEKNLFVETSSPYIPAPLELGDYDFIVRAYDQAGNFREVTKRVSVVTWAFEFVSSSGFQLQNVLIPWNWFTIIILLVMGLLFYFGRKLKWLHKEVDEKTQSKELPGHIKAKLEELSKYRQRYGKITSMFLLAILTGWMMLGYSAKAADIAELSPPYVTTISSQVSNQEIFYVGGKTDSSDTDVLLHLQNLQTGETFSYKVTSDKKGDWFYRHDQFLPSGKYIVWAQSKIADQTSAPSPQQTITVSATALQFGSSRLSYETIYLSLLVLALLLILGLIWYNFYHFRKYKKKQRAVVDEIHKAEESLRRGFAIIKRDIQAELEAVHKMKDKSALSKEELDREAALSKDLADIEQYVGQEIWELEKLEQS